jgi:hypothetical protein
MAVAWDMKKLGLLSFVISVLVGLSQPAWGSDYYYYPDDATYDSHGRVPTVRQVQLALEDEGYYVGDNHGNFGYETRAAVRRYQRDFGLPITGKIDTALLRSLWRR